MSGTLPNSEDGTPRRAVFLSYAREDAPAAQRIADALGSHGVEVWFDQSELRGGDVWDQKIRRQIKECALFIPIISVRTQARGEGYFRLEWKLAVERTHLMAEGVPFLSPVVVDETPEGAALVPAEFLRVQWVRLPGALPTPQFVAQVKRMMEPHRAAVPGTAPSRAPMGPAAQRHSRAVGLAVGTVAVAMVGVAAFLLATRHPQVAAVPATAPVPAAAAPAATVDAKSIAVLPFENMSEDKENAFFADGVHEDVLTNLSFVKDLHLVSRTSVMQYRGTTKSVKQIGQELGVAYILEGSVRREGNKVRVTGQLIDARTDQHLWAKAYDRDLTDIFAIQGELAQAIADALQSVLSPETKVLLARRPTENTEAYDDFVKARQVKSSSAYGIVSVSEKLLEDAVRLDPNFAQAWADLASRRSFDHFNTFQSDEKLGEAKAAIDNAVRLAPDDPVVIEGLGDYYYYGYRDYARAAEQYLRLAQLRPNDPAVYASLGLIQRRQGRGKEALPNLEHALELDPENFSYVQQTWETLVGYNRFDEAIACVRAFAARHPEALDPPFILCQSAFYKDGSTAAVKEFAKRTVDPADQAKFLYLQVFLAYLTGDWPELFRLKHLQRYFEGDADTPRWEQDVLWAEGLAESGDMPAARALASEALPALKAELARQPESALLWSTLALANSLCGDKDETRLCVQKTRDLLPESRDAIQGPANSINCALALAWNGDKDQAISEVQRLLRIPFGLSLYVVRASFRPLADDPRFKAVLADPTLNAPVL